jgi:protein disulfide-isomerase
MNPPRRIGRWLVALGIVSILVIYQWPMLKGMFYRVIGSPAGQSSVAWRTNLNDALAESRQTGKPVLADFSAEWCGPCQVMKHDVWTDAAVGREVERLYVPLAVDVDANGAVAQRYGINSIPAILILDASGKVLRRGSFMTRQEVLDFLAKNNR